MIYNLRISSSLQCVQCSKLRAQFRINFNRIKYYTLIIAIALASSAWSATYNVGPGQSYAGMNSLPVLNAGDLVQVYPGTYNETFRVTRAGTAGNPITIRGVGATRPLFDGTGLAVDGALPNPRAIFQVEASYVTIDNIEFKNADNGNNGAGIRVTNTSGGTTVGVVIKNCKITYCDMGMMSDACDQTLIQSCEVAYNGTSAYSGYSHNFYLNGNKTTVEYCYIHDSLYGQNFKTRGHYTELFYNTIANSQDGEVCLVDSSLTAAANSNAVMVGNIIISKVRESGWNDARFIWFGQDMGGSHNGTLYAYNNTFYTYDYHSQFLLANASGATAVMTNNVCFGSNSITGGPVSGSNNWLPSGASTGSLSGSVFGSDPSFVNPGSRDFHLNAGSGCINAGTGSLTYVDNNGASHSGVPTMEYVVDLGAVARTASGALDIGAYEYHSANQPPVITSAASATPNPATTGQSVSFLVAANDSDGDALSYSWNFGDGSTGSGASASHSYSAAGNYTATATVSDGNGNSVTSSVSVTVNAVTALPDVLVTSLSYANGIFTCTVLNQGNAPTPAGVLVGVGYSVDGTWVTWGGVNGPLAAGASVTIGTNGSPYTIPNGTHTITAYVDDAQRFAESNENNNQLSKTITIGNAASATFVTTDGSTQGNWKNNYGADGYAIEANSANYPAYASVAFNNANLYTWTSSTSDVRALLKAASNTDRIASCWYNNPNYTIDVNLTDGQTHQVALYCLDWDTNSRAQTITITDAGTGAVLDGPRALSSFNGGAYEVWKIQGHVTITLNCTAGYNAVVSGIFFGAGNGGGGNGDTVWVEDALPGGANPASDGGDSWNWIGSNPAPFSGSLASQSNITGGEHQHYFTGATQTLSVNTGDTLIAYVYLDPANLPSEIMLQWNDGSWEHRAYWGADNIGWGTDGTPSRVYMGALPAAGQWVRLQVPASAVGLEGSTLNGMAFTLYGGRATWDHAGKGPASTDTVWVEDSIPAGGVAASDGGDGWNWMSSNPAPYSGALASQSNITGGEHQHYFYNATQTLTVNTGDTLIAYVYLDPANVPSEIMLQWNDGSWEHRAYWGADNIGWGADGTPSRVYMGGLPTAGQWVRLQVPASQVGLAGSTLNGMAFTLCDGRATWDHAGTMPGAPAAPSVAAAPAVAAAQTSVPAPVAAPSTIDLGSVKVNHPFKLKLPLPASIPASSKLRASASGLPRGMRVSGDFIGGRPNKTGTYAITVQFVAKTVTPGTHGKRSITSIQATQQYSIVVTQ